MTLYCSVAVMPNNYVVIILFKFKYRSVLLLQLPTLKLKHSILYPNCKMPLPWLTQHYYSLSNSLRSSLLKMWPSINNIDSTPNATRGPFKPLRSKSSLALVPMYDDGWRAEYLLLHSH